MNGKEFQPKAFYRKFDSLLVRIGESAGTKEVLSLVLDELVQSFGTDLGITSGCIFGLRGQEFHRIKGPLHGTGEVWPDSISRNDPAVSLLLQHKSYIYAGAETPPWGNDSVAVVVGEDDQYIIAFKLAGEWVREALEFSLNTIRSTVNFSRSTSRFRADFEEAYEIQRSLLPESDPVFDGYEIAGRSISAEIVGGDLYDFHLLDEKVLGIAIGDASGHGLPAALLSRDVITGLRMGIENQMKISSVMKKLNWVINRSRLSTRFVSLVYGELEQNGTLVYSNAGHPHPILFKESGIEELNLGGTILGPIKEAVFKRGFAFLDPGDILVMFTDGIVERFGRDGEMFGKERLINFILGRKTLPVKTIVDELFADIFDFGGGDKLQDDATAVIIKRVQ